MADIILNVEVRERTGTGGARETRRAGLVPGVLYGGDKDPVAVAVKSNEFRKALYTGKLLGHLVTLKHGNETQPVIAKVVDMHPVTDEPIRYTLHGRAGSTPASQVVVAIERALGAQSATLYLNPSNEARSLSDGTAIEAWGIVIKEKEM